MLFNSKNWEQQSWLHSIVGESLNYQFIPVTVKWSLGDQFIQTATEMHSIRKPLNIFLFNAFLETLRKKIIIIIKSIFLNHNAIYIGSAWILLSIRVAGGEDLEHNHSSFFNKKPLCCTSAKLNLSQDCLNSSLDISHYFSLRQLVRLSGEIRKVMICKVVSRCKENYFLIRYKTSTSGLLRNFKVVLDSPNNSQDLWIVWTLPLKHLIVFWIKSLQ